MTRFGYYFFLGAAALCAQMTLVRGFFRTFYGNELFVHLIIASWLFWAGLGAVAGNRLKVPNTVPVNLLGVSLGLSTFLSFLWMRAAPGGWLGLGGEIPDLGRALTCAAFIPAPMSLVTGAQFSAAIRLGRETAGLGSKAYGAESLGFAAAGVLFTFFLSHRIELFSVTVVCAFQCIALIFLSRRAGSRILFLSFAVLIFLYGLTGSAERFDRESLQWRFPKNEKLLESCHSPSGHLEITHTGNQINFYENGALASSSQNIEKAETAIHIPLSFLSTARSICVLGGGADGLVEEALRYRPHQVLWGETDPDMTDAVLRRIPSLAASVQNGDVEAIRYDLRAFLRQDTRRFDAIILDVPAPSTALLNRFFTEEFFRLARNHLEPEGVFSLMLPYAPDQPRRELIDFDASVWKAMKPVFASVLALPEENLLLIGRLKKIPETKLLVERFENQHLNTRFLTPALLKYRLTSDRIADTERRLETSKASPNRDELPSGYFYCLLYFLSGFYPALSRFLTAPVFSGVLVLCAAGSVAFFLKKMSSNRAAETALATAGLSMMFVESILLLAYQTHFGVLYERVAILVASLMVGLCVGSLAALRFPSGERDALKHAAFFHVLWVFFSIGLVGALALAPTETVFILAAGLAGLLGGLEYGRLSRARVASIGGLYAADLFGSCLGVFAVPLLLIPRVGLLHSLLILAVINAVASGILFRRAKKI